MEIKIGEEIIKTRLKIVGASERLWERKRIVSVEKASNDATDEASKLRTASETSKL